MAAGDGAEAEPMAPKPTRRPKPASAWPAVAAKVAAAVKRAIRVLFMSSSVRVGVSALGLSEAHPAGRGPLPLFRMKQPQIFLGGMRKTI